MRSGAENGRLARMQRPHRLEDSRVGEWLQIHTSWRHEGDALVRNFTFKDFSEALGFVVRVGLLAEKRDHHPDIELGWGKARVLWTTHDAKGVTELDLALAEGTAALL